MGYDYELWSSGDNNMVGDHGDLAIGDHPGTTLYGSNVATPIAGWFITTKTDLKFS